MYRDDESERRAAGFLLRTRVTLEETQLSSKDYQNIQNWLREHSP
jgi:hypothetical protein